MKNIGFGKLAVACFLSPIWGGILVAIFTESGSVAYDLLVKVIAVCFVAAPVFLILWVVATKEERAALRAERKERRAEYNSPENVAKRADKRPVSAVLIGTTNRRSAVGTITRATVGGAFFGLAGVVGGAASGKSEATHATFSVKYASGRVATETVPVNSKRFKELSALLHT